MVPSEWKGVRKSDFQMMVEILLTKDQKELLGVVVRHDFFSHYKGFLCSMNLSLTEISSSNESTKCEIRARVNKSMICMLPSLCSTLTHDHTKV